MKSSVLPSYTTATTRADPWGIIAPYVPVTSYAPLCLTSHTLLNHFAPRLWNDPLRMVQLLRLDRNDELSWYLGRFIGGSVKVARQSTRALVLVLDFRNFATATADFLSSAVEESLEDTLRCLPTMFPRLRCLLLDGNPAFDPASLSRTSRQQNSYLPPYKPLLLSIARSSSELPASYFASEYTRHLVYLDISHMPGSLRTRVANGLFNSDNLPNLRILKARGRELDDAGVKVLCTAFGRQLWSLDVSDNKITDIGLEAIITCCIPNNSLWSDRRYDVEGKVIVCQPLESDEAGPFVTIAESDLSASFSHPERHLADPPAYKVSGQIAERPNGLEPLLRDGPDDILRFIAGGAGEEVAPEMVEEVMASRLCRGSGLTHLAIRENRVTKVGVERILRLCGGTLEHFECDMTLMRTRMMWFSPYHHYKARMYSFLGSSWLFRPVISSSLKSLHVHHSLVTQVPTITTVGGKVSPLPEVWLAEKMLLPRSELAWPGDGFIPDMNPRLTSLTLTNLPRRSAGPLVDKLKGFLKLLYQQERSIESTRQALSTDHESLRISVMLRGLRHLRLEFDQQSNPETGDETLENEQDTSVDLGPETEADMDQSPSDFSFFHTWGTESTAARQGTPQRCPSPSPSWSRGDQMTVLHFPPPGKPGRPPLLSPKDAKSLGKEPLNLSFGYSGCFVSSTLANSSTTSISVWVGPVCFFDEGGDEQRRNHKHHPVITEYSRNLQGRPSLRTDVGPATPAQIHAGVPEGVCLFQAAWECVLLAALDSATAAVEASDRRGMQNPVLGLPRISLANTRDLAAMVDVVAELKQFRATERTAGRHWTGKLEVAHQEWGGAAKESGFWR